MFEEWKAGFRSPSVYLENELDPDNEQPTRPGPLQLKRDAYWQTPHSMHLLFTSEADATARGAHLPWSRRLAAALLLSLATSRLIRNFQLLATPG
jgi:hypothetical protein